MCEYLGKIRAIRTLSWWSCVWYQVKPSSNQVNLASCCVMPPDLTAFAKEFDIQLLTHNDPKGEVLGVEASSEPLC